MVLAFLLVVVAQRRCLVVIHFKTLVYGFKVVVAASRFLAALEQAVDKFVVVDFKSYYGVYL
jgi:hypothetical protein